MSVIRLPDEHLFWIRFFGFLINMWSIDEIEQFLMREGRVMHGMKLCSKQLFMQVFTFSSCSFSRLMLKSPSIIASVLSLMFLSVFFNAALKWSMLPLGCLYIPPIIISWLFILRFIHLFSIWHLEQVQVFFRLKSGFTSISDILPNLLFLSSIATPPLDSVGLSRKMWQSGKCWSIIPIVVCLVSVRQIISNLNLKHLKYVYFHMISYNNYSL